MKLATRHWDPGHGPLQLSTLRRTLEQEGMVTAWWSDEGQALELGPGDRLDLPPHIRHATEVIGLGQVIYVTGTTDKQLLKSPS